MASKTKSPGAGVSGAGVSDKTIHQDVQEQDQVSKLLGSLIGQKITVKQTNGKELVGLLVEGNSEFLRLQQGTGTTKRHIYLFRAGLSELSTVETS